MVPKGYPNPQDIHEVICWKGPVVPTTTPPLVWPSNGKNKWAHTKIFKSYTYGGFVTM